MPTMSTDIFIWSPRNESVNYKITVNGEDVTDRVISAEFTMATTDEIGQYKIELINDNDYFTDRYSDGNEVILYLDYSDADTVRFKGYVEKRGSKLKSSYTYTINGRHISAELIDKTVTKSFTNESISDILKSIITAFGTGFTANNVSNLATTATFNWDGNPFWDCVIALCEISGYDCYVDNDRDFHFFERVNNENEAIVWNDNMITVEGLTEDSKNVVNKVVVNGEDSTGLPIIATAQDINSQNGSWIKERIVFDSDIKTIEEAQERADAELELTQPLEGESLSRLLPSLSPADYIWISVPAQKIHNRFKIVKYTHKFPQFQTKNIIKRAKTTPAYFKDRIKKEKSLETSTNPNSMLYSWNFSFGPPNPNVGINNFLTETSDGFLQIESGESTGIMTTDTKDVIEDINSVEFRVIGQNLQDTTFEVSADGGNNWDVIVRNILLSISVPGKSLMFRVNMKNPTGTTARIDSLAILYK